MHMQRRRKRGSYDPPPRKVGRKRVTGDGYVAVYRPDLPWAYGNGFVLEHRLVMSEHLGREIRETESVHHRNGDRSDNRLENLELWSKQHPYGARAADLVKWARELLATYGDEYDSGKL